MLRFVGHPVGPRVSGRRTRARALLAWFASHRRPLPWRLDRDPYRLWVAEVMLQQSRVAAVTERYQAFLARFPDVERLAASRLEDVLKAWEGAGYYARARHLHATAQILVREHRGRFPTTVEGLRALPGVGEYIAAAVASLAFDVRVVALEANGLRVAARWTLEGGDVRSALVRERLRAALATELPAQRAGAFNEAVMELGETVCLPRNPVCTACPVAPTCRARQELPDPSVLPRRVARSPPPLVVAAALALRSGDRWLVRRRPDSGLLGGLWELPGGRLEQGEAPEDAARRELREETGLSAGPLASVGVVDHAYSHFRLQLHVFHGPVEGPTTASGDAPLEWVTWAEFARRPRPKATIRAVALLERATGAASPGSGPRPGRTPPSTRGAGGAAPRPAPRPPGRASTPRSRARH
jgi:A/G-specific adenine glycosylase